MDLQEGQQPVLEVHLVDTDGHTPNMVEQSGMTRAATDNYDKVQNGTVQHAYHDVTAT